jgi:hypothetical protein
MKTLNIKNFVSATNNIVASGFSIKSCVESDKKYLMIVATYTNSYKLAIVREESELDNGEYQLFIYDYDRNKTYPMTARLSELKSKDAFVDLLTSILNCADKGTFGGSTGDFTHAYTIKELINY